MASVPGFTLETAKGNSKEKLFYRKLYIITI